MNKHIKIIIMQGIFLAVASLVIYLLYPKTGMSLSGNLVSFSSVNANVVIISENPDFSNPRYLDFERRKNISFNLSPGTYYWKASNNLIQGIENKFTIDSKVGMKIGREENNSSLVNIGNVKINVTKTDEGTMVGHIILEPEETEKIEDKNESYTGRQI